ncbi:unnamed protein product, partial [Trichogramma brassicae]
MRNSANHSTRDVFEELSLSLPSRRRFSRRTSARRFSPSLSTSICKTECTSFLPVVMSSASAPVAISAFAGNATPGGIVSYCCEGRVSAPALQMGFDLGHKVGVRRRHASECGRVRAGRVRPISLMGLCAEMSWDFPTKKTCWTSSLSLGESTDRRASQSRV